MDWGALQVRKWRCPAAAWASALLLFGCVIKREPAPLPRLDNVPLEGLLDRNTGAATYSKAFVYRDGMPGGEQPPRVWTDKDLPADVHTDDRNLIVFVEGSGDTAEHFRHTARLLAESPYHPAGNNPNLTIVRLAWCETSDTVREHLNYKAQERGAQLLRQFCKAHAVRHPNGQRFVGIVAFSAGTRVAQLAFGAMLPQGRPADAPPTLTVVPDEMRNVNNVVYLGSSISRYDPLPFKELKGRFINFVNGRDTHFGDRAPYFAPAGTSPLLGRLIQANLYLARPGTGASANGFAGVPVLTNRRQFDLIELNAELSDEFRLINVYVPNDLIPVSSLGIPLLDDMLDTYSNQAPNHYAMVGRGPAGTLASGQFDLYKELAYEFVREQVGSAVMNAKVYSWDLKAEASREIHLEYIPESALQLLLPKFAND